MRFPKDFPDKLRSSILTSEVVGKKVKLKARGHEFQGLCPFHNEKTPSFTVNDLKGFYHCFGCGEHGDLITFVMKNDGLEYPEAVAKLADDFGIEIPKIIINEAKENALERDYLILEKICQFFEKNLHGENGFEARNYLKKRNLNSASAKKFRLGFAPNSYETLIDFLKSEGFGELEISKTGVIGQNERQKLYSKFRNRVIFPITDKKNRVIAFGGRCLGDEMPKYLNSSETEFFKKNQTLYNFYFARKAIFTKGFAVVVEGYMDAIALATNGIENVVAGLGTALGAEHLKDLFYVTDKIIICLDGDEAGIRAAKRASEIALPLINAKKNIAFAMLPNRMDPDDFVKEFGARELEKVFENATPLSESLFDFALMELAIDKTKKISAENKAKIEGNLNAKIEAIKDVSTKKYFAFFFKDLLFFFGKKNQSKITNSVLIKNYAKPASSLSDSIARNIIALIIKYPELAQFRDDDFDVRELHFSNEDLSHLKELVIEVIDDKAEILKQVQDDAEGAGGLDSQHTLHHHSQRTHRHPELVSGSPSKNNLEENLLTALEKSPFSKDVLEIKNILARLGAADLDLVLVKFRILLLKDLLLHVELQYKESLSQIDEIETHQTAITNQKIKEIFDYKNSLEQRILTLEKELT